MIDSILNKLSEVAERFKEIEALLSQPDVTRDQKRYISLTKEYSELSPVVQAYTEISSIQQAIKEASQMAQDKDEDIQKLAESELEDLKNKLNSIEAGLKSLLLPKDPDDSKNVILEIRAGTGGDEAALFSGDLFRMYSRVAERRNWKIEVISVREGDHGGYKELVTRIEGSEVFKHLKFEAGVHRVQRVPETETQGRVHTSAATVAVLPEAEDIDVKVEEKDLRIDVFRSSGPGGQSVNTTDSAVRITHLPTGIVVSQQDEKSQHKNKAKAMKILRARIYEAEREKKNIERAQDRKSKIGTGDRSERIRTYNFPQGRVTDHRINLTIHKLQEFLNGDAFEELGKNLRIQDQEMKLANLKQ